MFSSFFGWLLGLLLSDVAAARTVPVSTLGVPNGYGSLNSFVQVGNNIVTFLANSIVYLAGAMFIVGALMFVFGGVNETMKSQGKTLMIGSVTGILVVGGSYAFYQTVVWFLYYT